MEYKEHFFKDVFLGLDNAIAKNWTLVEENVNSAIKSWSFFLKDYHLLAGYSL